MEAPMEKKESRTGAIIGSVAAIVLCGLTGLCLLCPLSVAIFANQVPDPTSQYGAKLTQAIGILPLCISIVFIAIGVVVPILLLRKKKADASAAVIPPSEPLPPAS
jgi:hypothetical protein